MKIPESLKTETARQALAAGYIIILLLIIPSLPLGKYGGGAAMLAFSGVGLVLYSLAYRERLRDRHLLKTAAIAALLAAAIAGAVSFLARWRWH